MKPLPVYPVYDIEPVRGEGAYIWDSKGDRYLDFYGGHAVISIGHSHPHYVRRISEQLSRIGFYSNSVRMPIQEQYAQKLGELSPYDDYDLFLCNSGAEAMENAIKVAAFNSKRNRIIVFEKGFHGRTSMAVSCTDNDRIRTQFDNTAQIQRLPLNDLDRLEKAFDEDVAAVIVEGILGIGGIHVPTPAFLQRIRSLCDQYQSVMVMDEVQSGVGRSGKFFAHEWGGVKPDVIALAKGMGNGFPIGGVLVRPEMEAWKGMLGSTFGGNHLACAAGLAVLEVIEEESLLDNALRREEELRTKLNDIQEIKEIRGHGLMLGLVFDIAIAELRKSLVFDHNVFTGSSSEPNVLRLLPPLSIGSTEIDMFVEGLETALRNLQVSQPPVQV
ncbi:MAG: aspartate aminotransferase family protein [Bacteroidota bacterium]